MFPFSTIVVEGLGRAILIIKDHGDFAGISFGNRIFLTHVLFVDDIVMIINGYEKSLLTLHDVLSCFCKAYWMMINDKSTLLYVVFDVSELNDLRNVFSFSMAKIEMGLKYLVFHLKPCRYFIEDWDSLVVKVENWIKNWSYHLLSKGGKLVLVKTILEAISLYWMHLWIPLGIIEHIRKICFKFLWSTNLEHFGLALTSRRL